MMSLDDHKAMSRRANGLWASNSPESFEDIFADNYVNHQEPDVEGGVRAEGLETYKGLLGAYHASFSNSRVKVLTQVATRWEFTATHTGDFMDLAPTQKEATWTGIQIDRFENGKIVESWVDWDKYRLFQTLGLVE